MTVPKSHATHTTRHDSKAMRSRESQVHHARIEYPLLLHIYRAQSQSLGQSQSCLEPRASNHPSTMSSQRSRRTPKPPSKRTNDSLRPVEILSQVGRVALPFLLTTLAQQQEEKQRQQERERAKAQKPSTSRAGSRNDSRTRAPSTARRSRSSHGKDTDRPRNNDGPTDTSSRDDGDFHGVIGQVAVGLVAFGAKKLIQRRKEAKRAAASAAQTAQANGRNTRGNLSSAEADLELSRALETTAVELQGASESIRKLANSGSKSHHRKCEVREELVKDAERLEGSLASIQTGIHNMRNLHPRLCLPDEGDKNTDHRGTRGMDQTRGERVGHRDWLKERYRGSVGSRGRP
ncbi:hypothetical protein QBC41DRAFT_58116 [Cercophora samala]|uniref:Uncharacterized protein n=1 Tax=Cercophora samala TaxID=330535 RepID=A0AA40DEH9_9PEZI|nr:hypothetical protein QBC41DRAFT_58116 [Cercophora samala]